MKPKPILAVLLLVTLMASRPCAGDVLSLAGEWRFALDRADAGISERWFAKDLAGKIQLPGILQAQGYGDDIATNTPWVLTLGDAWWNLQPPALRDRFSQPGHVEVPFLSQPLKHYLGAAWYQRDLNIPARSSAHHYSVFLERVHWKSTVWLDDREIGSDLSLSTPHEFDLGKVTPGKHHLTIRVDNRLQLPAAGHLVDSHSISDALGAAWNGIVGQIELRSTPPVWIERLQNFADVSNQTVRVHVTIKNVTGAAVTNTVTLGLMTDLDSMDVRPDDVSTCVIPPGGMELDRTISRKASQKMQWDEFLPMQFSVAARLGKFQSADESFLTAPVPFREIVARDKDIFINGRLANLRLTHFGGDFPLTGFPAMDVATWEKIFLTCKNYGLNGMRFHSWCPPEAAFEAADDLGFYLQPECGLWADFGNEPTREFLEAETARILAAYGNHPSFILLSPSNEPKNYSRFTPQWAATNYAQDNRRLYAADSGWGDPAQVQRGGAQYAVLARFGDNRNLRNTSGWFGRDYRDALENVHIPVLAHEVGQWCAYPDFEVMKKFTGYLRPGNYDIFRYIAQQQGVLEENREFAWASGRFQLACYKEEIEANLRTPGLAGFQLLDLHDYLGQGTALIGVLDAFWEGKGYAGPDDFKEFCNSTVPLARLTKRTFTTADQFSVPVEVAHFGDAPLDVAVAGWQIVNAANEVVAHGDFAVTNIPIGKNFSLGTVSTDLSKLPAPAQYQLSVVIGQVSHIPKGRVGVLPPFINRWNFWLYPAQVPDSKTADVLVTSAWGDAEKKLAAGGKVLFLPTAADLDPATCPPMKNVPVFWNIQMTVRPPQNPRPRFDAFLGLLCETNHPALAEFPTDKNCDWQWTQIINGVRAINLSAAPRDLKPIVWSIDDWNRNWKLGVLFECKVGTGRLLVSAINLNDAHGGSELQQLRRSVLDYMGAGKFDPAITLTPEQADNLWSHDNRSRDKEPARVFDPDLNDGSLPAPKKP